MSEAKMHHFCWNELITGDSKAAKDFYQELLGWESHDIDLGEVIYTIFKKGDDDVCGMMQMSDEMKENTSPQWMSYIKVDDVVAVTDKAQSLGAIVLLPIKDVPGYGKFSVLLDPTGASLAFWESTK